MRTSVYIDGFNLYYGSLKRTPYKWLDVRKLCQAILTNDTIQSIKYFTANVSSRPDNLQLPIRQQIYFRALRTIPNLSIIHGRFLTHSVRMILTDSMPIKKVWVNKTEEKGSDVNLAAHLLRDGFKGLYDVAVILSNDSDLAEPVRIVREDLNLSIGILNPHQTNSKELQKHAKFVKRIRQRHLSASQFPDIMTDGKGQFSKPTTW